MQVEFNNCAAAVIRFIRQTQSDIRVLVCWFTHPFIFDALLDALHRGVRVHIVVNHDQINFRPEGLDFVHLARKGATVQAYTGQSLMHYKYAISDDQQVLSGSFNWTTSRLLDCVTIVRDDTAVKEFGRTFLEISGQARTLAQIREVEPKAVHFTRLIRPVSWSVHDLRKRIIAGAKVWLVKASDYEIWRSWQEMNAHYLDSFSARCMPGQEVSDWLTAYLNSGAPMAHKAMVRRYGLRIRPDDIVVAVLPDGRLLGAGSVQSGLDIAAQRLMRAVQWLPCRTPVILSEARIKQGCAPCKLSAMAIAAHLG